MRSQVGKPGQIDANAVKIGAGGLIWELCGAETCIADPDLRGDF